jgi:very-short-patch-repair endonuclease
MFNRARQLRRNATPEETMLCAELRGTKLGIPIRRQHPLGTVVVDFYCPRAKVAIELDGAHHDADKDAERDRQLSERRIVVLRFENFQVRENLSGVVAAIHKLVIIRASLLGDAQTSSGDADDD